MQVLGQSLTHLFPTIVLVTAQRAIDYLVDVVVLLKPPSLFANDCSIVLIVPPVGFLCKPYLLCLFLGPWAKDIVSYPVAILIKIV